MIIKSKDYFGKIKKIKKINIDDKASLLSVFNFDILPFKPKRIFTVNNSSLVIRGNHAHKYDEQVVFCISGSIILNLTNSIKTKAFNLNENTSYGVYIPKFIWTSTQYKNRKSTILVICKNNYDEKSYIRKYLEYIKIVSI